MWLGMVIPLPMRSGQLTQVNGFLNQTGVTVVTAQYNWATATIEQVLSDFNKSLADATNQFDGDASIEPIHTSWHRINIRILPTIA
jgi:regulation of enolase protein 1 (concanavalin A-like superfamily)